MDANKINQYMKILNDKEYIKRNLINDYERQQYEFYQKKIFQYKLSIFRKVNKILKDQYKFKYNDLCLMYYYNESDFNLLFELFKSDKKIIDNIKDNKLSIFCSIST